MDEILLFTAGMVMAALIFFFMRGIGILSPLQAPVHNKPIRPLSRRRFLHGPSEVFTPKTLAIDFDEMGPGVSVNGEFHNPFERTRVDLVTAEVEAGGQRLELICGEELEEEDLREEEDKFIGDLVYMGSPTWLEEDQAGKFRAPMRDYQMEDHIAEILDKIDEASEKMVSRMDMEGGSGYSLEEPSLQAHMDRFMADFVVRGLIDEISKLFIWSIGGVRLTVWFLDDEDGIIDEIPIDFRIEEGDMETLRRNIAKMAANSLLAELGLDLLEYERVVLESQEMD